MNISKLNSLGWSSFFYDQLTPIEIAATNKSIFLFRIIAIHRSRVVAVGEAGEVSIIALEEFQPISQFIAVGDWVIGEAAYEHYRVVRLLKSKNRVERLSKGSMQLIAANLDFLWIVTSANDEFNIKRLQRYLAMSHKFNIEPVIILTKLDLCKNPSVYLEQIDKLNVKRVHCISKPDLKSYEQLDQYYVSGNSIALVGSSGVGKSTIINVISNSNLPTKNIRESDDKGQHTTTHRELFYCRNNVAIIDTPGMRELHLVDAEVAVKKTFDDINTLISQCKFNDCSHSSEPGCAINKALKSGVITEKYYANYLKIMREDSFYKHQKTGSRAEKKIYRNIVKR
ncbi:MAG: ribosome small subunit-dependent GTPase A [Rhizobiales bacterium]|nr:ribosome small subunit-dependent GTPase A [Hyphomicrobiales bacterium]